MITNIWITIALLSSTPAWASTYRLEPIEVREQAPPAGFSERAGAWHYLETPSESFADENRPLQDNLNLLPGIQARSGGSPTISIRGSSQADRVLSLYNDIPLGTAGGLGTPALLIPQENIDRALVFKGPASVFYGASAMAGAVNFIPVEHDRPTVRLGAVSNNTADRLDTKSVYVAAPLVRTEQNPHALQATVFTQGDSGQYPYTLSSNGMKGVMTNNDSDLQRYTLSGSQVVRGYHLRQDVVVAHQLSHTPGSYYFRDETTTNEWDTLTSLAVEKSVDARNSLSFRTSGIWQDGQFDSENSGATSSRAQQFLNSIGYHNQTTEQLSTDVFLDWKYNQLQASYNTDPDLHESLYEGGVQFQFPTDTWTVQTGVRFISGADQVVTALGAFRQQHDRQWITFSQGYRQPSLSDRYANFETFVGNPDLKPEFSQNIEAGYLKTPTMESALHRDGPSYGATVFATNYTNLIESESVGTTYHKVNRTTAKSSGVELLGGWSQSVWNIEATAQFMKSNVTKTGQEMTLAPKQQYTLTTGYQLGPVVTELRHVYWSPYRDLRMGTNESIELGPRRTWDLGIRTVGLADWVFRAGVRNLFDAQMESTYGYPEPGRQVYMSGQRYF